MNALLETGPTSRTGPTVHPADRLVAGLPVVDGEVDAGYLAAALGRADRPARVGQIEATRLDGGRISANVFSLKTDAGAFVLKKFVPEPWRIALFGSAFNEPALWSSGLTRSLPKPLSCPTIDVAFHRERGECWMLMDDVSAGVAPRGSFDEANFRQLLDGLARLHGRHWEQGSGLAELPVLTLDQHTAMFTDPCAAAGGRIEPTGWVAEVLDKVFLFRRYVPALLDALSPADADFYLDLCQHRARWLAPLSRLPQTLIHGDIRRANVAALPSGGISLFDWDFAARAPAAADLAWYWFLHFWCYPPRDGLPRRIASRSGPTMCTGSAKSWVGGSTSGIRARVGTLLAQGARADRVLPRRSVGGHAFGRRHCAREGAVREGHRQGAQNCGRPCV